MDNDSLIQDGIESLLQENHTPYFSKKQMGDFMDKHSILQMCRASFAVQREQNNPLIVRDDESGYVKLSFEGGAEAVIFPYAQNQFLNERPVNVEEVLPTSFYQANWPNPVGYQE